jgi:uncharacterized surface protein with fasciclin (FAS1) repeats
MKESQVMRLSPRTRTAAAALAAALVLAACGGTEEPAAVETPAPAPVETEVEEEAPAEELGTIVDVAVAAGDFTTLVAAIQAAGLVETLSGAGPFTVFAPTDAAFAALPEGLVAKLLLPENRDVLVSILTYHVVSGTVLAADVAAGEVTTVQGEAITLATEGGVTVNGANVIAVDVLASNGVIHVIDAVILPPSLDLSTL